MLKNRRLTSKKLLVASVGVASVTYSACNNHMVGNLVACTDPQCEVTSSTGSSSASTNSSTTLSSTTGGGNGGAGGQGGQGGQGGEGGQGGGESDAGPDAK